MSHRDSAALTLAAGFAAVAWVLGRDKDDGAPGDRPGGRSLTIPTGVTVLEAVTEAVKLLGPEEFRAFLDLLDAPSLEAIQGLMDASEVFCA